MKEYFASLSSFITNHPKFTTSVLFVLIAKAAISIFTPLSEDFLTTGVLVAPASIWAILKTDGPYLLWILLVKGTYTIWQILPVNHPPAESMVGFWYFFPSLSSQLLIFMLKLPLLVFDGLCALTIYKIASWYGSSQERSLIASMLWLVNPYATLITEMFGAYDVIVVFFFLLSILCFLKERFLQCAIALTVSICFKPYPLIVLPIFLIILMRQKGLKGVIKFALTTLILTTAAILAVTIYAWRIGSLIDLFSYYSQKGSAYFIGFILESYTSRIGWTVPIQIGATIVFAVIYIFLMIEFWGQEKRSILDALLGLCLIIFAFSYWHPQLLLWILPLITLDYILNKTARPYPLIFVSTAFLFELIYFSFYFTSHGNSLFFIPNYTQELTGLSNLIYPLYKTPYWIGSPAITLRSVFVSVCLYYLIKILIRNINMLKAYVRALSLGQTSSVQSSSHLTLSERD